MKKILLTLMLAIIFSEAPPVVAAISKVKGDVKIRPSDNRKYASAYKGQMIRNGDWIKTDYGVFLGIIFLDGSNIKIHENTEIEIKSSASPLRTEGSWEKNDLHRPVRPVTPPGLAPCG